MTRDEKNQKIWRIIDHFENGDITEREAVKMLLKLNNGDAAATEEDMRLLLKR